MRSLTASSLARGTCFGDYVGDGEMRFCFSAGCLLRVKLRWCGLWFVGKKASLSSSVAHDHHVHTFNNSNAPEVILEDHHYGEKLTLRLAQ